MWREIKGAIINRRIQELVDDILSAELEQVPIQLHLPNLRCRGIQFHGGLVGLPLQITATIQNAGLARSRECGILAHVWLSSTGQTQTLTARCPALNSRESSEVELGSIPNVSPDQFVNATVIVDPPTAQRPGGEVWESNEEDNICSSGVYLAPAPVGDLPGGEPTPKQPPSPLRKQ